MGRILFLILLAVSWVGSAGAQEMCGPAAEKVKAELLKFKQEQDKAFDSTRTSYNYTKEWFSRYEADGLVHMEDRVRNKTELVDELDTGKRKIISSKHYGHQFHIYGNGKEATLAIVTYYIDVVLELNGKREIINDFAVDTLIKSGGQWYVAVHAPHHREL